MSKHNVWLCLYNDQKIIPTFAFHADYPNNCDAIDCYRLEEKRLNKGLSDDEKLLKEQMVTKRLAIGDKQDAGESIGAENMPTQLYLIPDCEAPRFTEALFRVATGMFVVNEACYNIMQTFSLGKTHFSKVTMYDMETQTQLSDVPYYFINIAETEQYFNHENSKGVSASRHRKKEPNRYIGDPKDDDIILSKQALSSEVAIWHDPLLFDSAFMSDGLVQTLFQAGFTQKELGLVRCVTR